jgi:hypothetical protein
MIEKRFTCKGRDVVVADLWDVSVDDEFVEGGYGTLVIAMRAARLFIDDEVPNLEGAALRAA